MIPWLVPEAYRALFRIPGTPRLMLFAMIGRIPIGSVSLGLVLLVHDEFSSYATAGGVAAAYAIGGGALAPVQGRQIDRRGHAQVLVPLAVLNAAALIGVVLAAREEATVATYACAAAAGAAIPPLSACMRALWSSLLGGDDRLPSAYALEAVATEVFFVLGPLLAAAIAALASPAEAVLVAAGMSLVGTFGFIASPISRAWRSEPRTGSPVGALATPGMRTLVLSVLPASVAFGTLEVALPAFADEHGSVETGGVLLAALAAGSMAGGFLYGARVWKAPLERRYLQLTALFAVGLALPPLADDIVLLAALMVLAGMSLAPIVTVSYSLIDRLAPSGTATEAYTWVITANVAGAALGTAAAGAVAQHHDAQTALGLACAGAVLGFLVTLTRRRTLAAPDHGHGPLGAAPMD